SLLLGIVTLFSLLSGPCKPMGLDNSPEPLWLPRKVPMRVPENPALLLLGGALVLANDASPAIGTECSAVVLVVKVRQEPSSVSLCPPEAPPPTRGLSLRVGSKITTGFHRWNRANVSTRAACVMGVPDGFCVVTPPGTRTVLGPTVRRPPTS